MLRSSGNLHRVVSGVKLTLHKVKNVQVTFMLPFLCLRRGLNEVFLEKCSQPAEGCGSDSKQRSGLSMRTHQMVHT